MLMVHLAIDPLLFLRFLTALVFFPVHPCLTTTFPHSYRSTSYTSHLLFAVLASYSLDSTLRFLVFCNTLSFITLIIC